MVIVMVEAVVVAVMIVMLLFVMMMVVWLSLLIRLRRWGYRTKTCSCVRRME